MRKLDPRDLYEVVADPDQGDGGPVLVHALEGFVDAGRVVELARTHLAEGVEPELIARFDVDQLHDYRARRPLMRFDRDHFASVDMPELAVHQLRDSSGTAYLLMTGPEPDAQWERFTTAVELLTGELGVRLTVGLAAFPMGVPHTRPTHVVVHSSSKELLAGYEPWLGSVLVPGAMTNLLEFRLGEAGLPSLGLAATVPQYLATSAHPAASAALLKELSSRSGLRLDLTDLDEAAATSQVAIDAQVKESAEVQAVVRTLEEAYDAASAERLAGLANDASLPSADELGAQFEQFLAEQGKDDS